MGGIDADVFRRAIAVDYSQLKRDGTRIAAALSGASTCRVTSAAGTDLTLRLEERVAISDDGDMRALAAWGNLPAGEAFIAPIETRGDGIIVFDGSLAGYGALDAPLSVRLVEGWLADASGPAGQWLMDTLEAGGPTGRMIAELGIGTSPSALVTGNTLEDEKVLGTAHSPSGRANPSAARTSPTFTSTECCGGRMSISTTSHSSEEAGSLTRP